MRKIYLIEYIEWVQDFEFGVILLRINGIIDDQI